MTTFKKGDIVLYGSDPGQRTGCVIERGPWKTANGDEVYRIIGPCFMTGVCDAAFAGWMELAPTYFSATAREWTLSGYRNCDPDGIIGYAFESDEALSEGWCWYVEGRTGNSLSYEAARARVEELCK